MGHVDVKTTMRYVHETDEGRRRAVEAAGKRVSEKAATICHNGSIGRLDGRL
jgi:hypothetical protein